MIDFIIDNLDKDDVIKIIMMYVNLYEYFGDEKFGATADVLIRRTSMKED